LDALINKHAGFASGNYANLIERTRLRALSLRSACRSVSCVQGKDRRVPWITLRAASVVQEASPMGEAIAFFTGSHGSPYGAHCLSNCCAIKNG